ncbi:MAG: protein kinase [Candidatus Latescibacterota bacterium]|nr:MAG: protein kinase [Candidatus Latescibacterota bacterium]
MIGKTISHYKILDKLGEGGMGVVYKAEDTKLKRTVALKFLPPELTRDKTAKKRFIQEAQTASTLDHSNICTIHEIDETPEGQIFICMTFYEGEALRARIERGPLEIADTIDIITSVAEGLAKAHDKGITHRDIKPANILITNDEQVKIVDFGLAKLAGQTRVTKTGTTVGTAAYMSPEQAKGGNVDHRTDIWSLGVVLYEMVTGELPFKGEYEHAITYSIINETPRRVTSLRSDATRDLEKIVDKALAKSPDDRYQHVRDVVTDLRSLKTQIEHKTITSPIDDTDTVPSIAVLPFVNMSPDLENAYFADGLAEELINALTHLKGLRVAARTSAFSFRGKEVDIREIGQKLNVRTILEGSVRKAGNRLRVTAQLINIEDGYHMWSDRYDREMEDIFAIQDEIARAIVQQLRVKLVGPKDQTLVSCGTENLEAYTALLEGRYYLHSLTPDGWAKSYELLKKSIALDPSFALPHAWLSDYYQSLGWWGGCPPHEVMPKSRAAAQRAIELDEKLGMAHGALAVVLWSYDWDSRGAEREFRRALEIDPTSGFSRMRYALYLSCQGRNEETIDQARLALRLEPLDGLLAAWVASTLLGVGAFEEATDTILKAIAMEQDHWQLQLFLGFAYLFSSREKDAADVLEQAVDLSGEASVALALLGVAYHAMGAQREADELAKRLVERSRREYVAPWLFACLSAARGEKSDALAHLRRAIEERDLFIVTRNIWPQQARLRGPEIDALLKKAGLR